MSRILSLAAATVVLYLPLCAQQPASKRETVSLHAGRGKRLTIEYSRPLLTGAATLAAMLPPGKISPIGGQDPATLTTEADISVGEVLIPEGRYSLFLLPSESGWKLVVNSVYKPGGFEYDPKADVGRFDLAVTKAAAPVDRLTILLTPGGGGSGKLKLEWGDTSAVLSFSVITY